MVTDGQQGDTTDGFGNLIVTLAVGMVVWDRTSMVCYRDSAVEETTNYSCPKFFGGICSLGTRLTSLSLRLPHTLCQPSSSPSRSAMPPDQPSIRRRPRKSQRRRDGLLKYAKDNTSQSGEDGIISRIFHVLPPPPDGKVYRCVDVGAWDGKHLSNTYSLLVSNTSNQKWRGVLIEPDVQRFRDLRALHEPLQNICLKLAVSGLPHAPKSLVNILSEKVSEIDLSGGFDFLCIDIDGSDYWVLSDLLGSKRFLPRVICIEFNPTMPVDLVYIPPRNDAMRHGASVSALVELAETHNYTLVETTLYNAFFVETSLFQAYLRQEVPDTSIEALHEPTMATSLYQLYDGTIKLWGCKRMLWHRIPVSASCLG